MLNRKVHNTRSLLSLSRLITNMRAVNTWWCRRISFWRRLQMRQPINFIANASWVYINLLAIFWIIEIAVLPLFANPTSTNQLDSLSSLLNILRRYARIPPIRQTIIFECWVINECQPLYLIRGGRQYLSDFTFCIKIF